MSRETRMIGNTVTDEIMAAALIVAGRKYGGRVGEADELCAIRVVNYALVILEEIDKRRETPNVVTLKRGPGRPPKSVEAE